MKRFTKIIPLLVAAGLIAIPSAADAYGYQYARTSISGKWQAVNGFITVPTAYASSPTTETYPELFYGFYNSSHIGFDFGIGLGLYGTAGARIIFNGHSQVYPTNGGWSQSDHLIPTVNPGDELQMQAAVSLSGAQYYAILDVYKNGTWLDSWQVPIQYAWASAWMANGGTINRELNVASNNPSSIFTHSGVYMYNAKGGRAWLIQDLNNSNSWYAWTPARTSSSPYMWSEGESGVTANPNYFNASSTTDANGYAIDQDSIYFPAN